MANDVTENTAKIIDSTKDNTTKNTPDEVSRRALAKLHIVDIAHTSNLTPISRAL
jgi:BRCT domain type II-containing protein